MCWISAPRLWCNTSASSVTDKVVCFIIDTPGNRDESENMLGEGWDATVAPDDDSDSDHDYPEKSVEGTE